MSNPANSSLSSLPVSVVDATSSLTGVAKVVRNRLLAKRRLEDRIEFEKEKRRRRREEAGEIVQHSDDEEEDDDGEEETDEEHANGDESKHAPSHRSRPRRTTVISSDQAAAASNQENPFELLVKSQQAHTAPISLVDASATVVPENVWSAELVAATAAVDESTKMDEVDWEEEETTTVQQPPPPAETTTDNNHTAAANEYDGNDEVLFGEDFHAPVHHGEDAGHSHADVEMAPAAADPSPSILVESVPPPLNRVTVPSKAGLDPTSAVAESVSRMGGDGLEISFEAVTNEEVAAELKAKKAAAKAQKAESKTKSKGDAAAAAAGEEGPKPAAKRRSGDSAGTKRSRASSDDSGKKVQSAAPAQRMTKALRELIVHIQHVHLLSHLYLIQQQSDPLLGIMNDPLILAKLLSIVHNRCPGLQTKRYAIDPRHKSTWVGSSVKKKANANEKKGITWKSSHQQQQQPTLAAASRSQSQSQSQSPLSPSSSSPPPSLSSSSAFTAIPEAADGTIFSRVQKLAYWFRSYFHCHQDRIDHQARDKQHPLYNYDTNLHMRSLHEVHCTCVHRRMIVAGVKGFGLTNPWLHYHTCLRRQFDHVIQTREGGFQQLTMIFVMLLRSIGVLTRLCYGLQAVNYKKDLSLPTAEEQQAINDAIQAKLEASVAGDSSLSRLGATNTLEYESVVAELLRSEHVKKQDPTLIGVLDRAVREVCQCEKPFESVAFGTPTKQAALKRERDAADEAAASAIAWIPDGPKEETNNSSSAKRTKTGKALRALTRTPSQQARRSDKFLSSETINLADTSESEAEVHTPPPPTSPSSVTSGRSPHFRSSANNGAATTKSLTRSRVARKLDVDPATTTLATTSAPLTGQKRTRSSFTSNGTATTSKENAKESAADSSLSNQKKTPARSTRNKKVNYFEVVVLDKDDDDGHTADATKEDETASEASAADDESDSDDDDDDDEEEEEAPNPCIVCGLNESTDEVKNPILLCDECDSATCLKCVKPSIKEMPDEFYCAPCQAKKLKGKNKSTKKSRAPKRKTADDSNDSDVPEADTKSSCSSRKPAATRRARSLPSSSSGDIDLTVTPPASPEPASKKAKLTRAKSMATATATSMSPSTASELPSFTDEENEARTHAPRRSSPTTQSSATKDKSSKLPKKQYFEHAYPLIWCEFYCPEEKRWIHVDVMRHLFDSEIVYEHDGGLTLQYVIAIRPSSDGAKHLLTDVTKRYTSKWSQVAGHRVDDSWFIHQMQQMSGRCHELDREIENDDHHSLEQRHTVVDQIPTRLNEFKTHPLYCIEKFNKKFEMIYPSGKEHSKGVFIEKRKGLDAGDIVHLVYPRTSLHLLHTLDRWRREQRAVKQDEVPYPVKVVKKLSQMSRQQREEKIRKGLIDPEGEKSELYGIWQTEPWLPEAAQNGIVPKNERGHVDVWGSAHIPPGCIHLPHPRIKAACKKLNVDFADAMTGFDVRGGRSVPRFEGVVICQEFGEAVMAAYREIENAALSRAEDRRLKAVRNDWKRLVRGSIVHTRVMKEVMERADFNQPAFAPGQSQNGQKRTSTHVNPSTRAPSTPYGTLVASLHESANAAVAASSSTPILDPNHIHSYTQRRFDVSINAWTSFCACGASQTVEEM